MIPVFQTRSTPEEIGNCLEACIASILELPLTAIPDRADFVDVPLWRGMIAAARAKGGEKAVGGLEEPEGFQRWESALSDWLAERGLAATEMILDKGMTERGWMELDTAAGYWIGSHYVAAEATKTGQHSHAVVYCGAEVVHNPYRGVLEREGLGALHRVFFFSVLDPRLIVRVLGRQMLPDINGALELTEQALELLGNGHAEVRRLPTRLRVAE